MNGKWFHWVKSSCSCCRNRDTYTFKLQNQTLWVSDQISKNASIYVLFIKYEILGLALTTSPLGLAAYILEKFSTWTNRSYRSELDGKLTEKFSLDDVLTNVMIYWISGNIMSSQRFYKENFSNEDLMVLDRIPTPVPTGVACYPEEIFVQPESFIRSKFPNLMSYTDSPAGGHFGAFEQPKMLFNDLVQFVQLVENMGLKKSKSEL
jgi:hypothetical protein